jgi:UDP-N-acetylmuramate dehydrogenase
MTLMAHHTLFADFVQDNVPLAPFTYLKLGGPAEQLATPRSCEELTAFVQHCFEQRIPLYVLGNGCNLLIPDEGLRGAVIRLSAPVFAIVEVEGRRVKAGAGAALSTLISQAARHALTGLEALVGILGTVGGSLRCNAGDRMGEIGQHVRSVEVMDNRGVVHRRERDELRFSYHASNLDDPVLLSAEFELEADDPDAIVKRMRKAWIVRKASQPLTFQAAARIFQNPRGLNAAALIEQAGLARTRVGGAEVSERDANCIIVHPGATCRDVMRLIDLIRTKVQERFNVELELEITLW